MPNSPAAALGRLSRANSTPLPKAWVAETLAYYKVPAHWQIRRTALPRNAAGKVMKHVLLGESENPFDAA